MLAPRVKLADVAKVVGVSTATVSRVVNGKPGVAEATRTAVLAGLETLGYRIDDPQGTHEGLIAVMVPELGNPTFGFFTDAQKATKSVLGRWSRGEELTQSDMRGLARLWWWQNTMPVTQLYSTMISNRIEK